MLGAVQVDVGELTHLLTELVELATDGSRRRGARGRSISASWCDRGPSGRAPHRPRHQVVETAPDLPSITGPPLMLERAVSNLVDNAVKYSPPDGPSR